MRKLEEIRPDIDRVDRELKELFCKRMQLVKEVGEYKKQQKLPVKNQQREDSLVAEKLSGITEFSLETEAFFRTLIDLSCDYQERLIAEKKQEIPAFLPMEQQLFFEKNRLVCYQGVEGSYSHEVCSRLFPNAKLESTASFRSVFERVSKGACDIGVVPMENITAGAVTEVYEALNEMELYIAASPILPIKHVLMGVGELSQVTTVTSHPQALSQCSRWIAESGLQPVSAPNTAVAAKKAKEQNDPSVAVIGSREAARRYGLSVLQENIADITDNQTRFIVITKQPILLAEADTISMIFSIPHEVGSLSRVLQQFSRHHLNLTMIESMPSKGGKWEYLFYVDVRGNLTEQQETLEAMGYLFDYFKITGNYPKILLSEEEK